MEITKHNIHEVIEKHLNKLRIRYDIEESGSKGCLYELFILSTPAFIQVEYNLDDEIDDSVVLQLFTKIDNCKNPVYESDWNSKNCDSVEGEILDLVVSVKKINKGISKIASKIEQIKEICEKYELEFDDFISVNYDFNEWTK